jgi:excisionase family DNA binding protein
MPDESEPPRSPQLAIVQPRYTVSPKQAAEMLGVATETVLRMIRSGELRASRLSPKTLRIRVADLDALLDARRT